MICASFPRKNGFTLIELSLVLVIIGLLIGGVLAGKELINAASIRSQVSQIDQFNVAANTFRTKYNCLPGDCANAAQMGLTQSLGFTDGYGAKSIPNDGLIMSCRDDTATLASFPPNGFVAFGCENSVFWYDLYQTNLISNSISQTSNTGTWNAITSQYETYVPKAKMNDNYVLIHAFQGQNYFRITGLGSGLSNGNGAATLKYALTPLQAFQIDSKIDDGLPTTGTAQARDGQNFQPSFLQSSATACNTTSSLYNTTGIYANTNLCALQVKASF